MRHNNNTDGEKISRNYLHQVPKIFFYFLKLTNFLKMYKNIKIIIILSPSRRVTTIITRSEKNGHHVHFLKNIGVYFAV